MIPQKIQALFAFIDYFDQNKIEYIEKYLPLCNELSDLDNQRSRLKPKNNYIDKQKYDDIQKEISEKFQPITQNIYTPVLNKLKDLGIWSGDNVFTSIWNNNISVICDFKENFASDDISEVIAYKLKYLSFRKETDSNFLCLQFVLSNLDEIFKELFDFFKDTTENEFESFETKTIEVNSIKDAVKGCVDNKGKSVRFSIPHENILNQYKVTHEQLYSHMTNEIIMGDKIQIGDITNHSGQIIVGKDIKVSDSLHGKNETADKISELIDLIRREQNANDEQRQLLITNLDKVKEELFNGHPSKSKIFKWLSNTKEVLGKLVLSHEVTQAVDWVYRNLNFIFH